MQLADIYQHEHTFRAWLTQKAGQIVGAFGEDDDPLKIWLEREVVVVPPEQIYIDNYDILIVHPSLGQIQGITTPTWVDKYLQTRDNSGLLGFAATGQAVLDLMDGRVGKPQQTAQQPQPASTGLASFPPTGYSSFIDDDEENETDMGEIDTESDDILPV